VECQFSVESSVVEVTGCQKHPKSASSLAYVFTLVDSIDNSRVRHPLQTRPNPFLLSVPDGSARQLGRGPYVTRRRRIFLLLLFFPVSIAQFCFYVLTVGI